MYCAVKSLSPRSLCIRAEVRGLLGWHFISITPRLLLCELLESFSVRELVKSADSAKGKAVRDPQFDRGSLLLNTRGTRASPEIPICFQWNVFMSTQPLFWPARPAVRGLGQCCCGQTAKGANYRVEKGPDREVSEHLGGRREESEGDETETRSKRQRSKALITACCKLCLIFYYL